MPTPRSRRPFRAAARIVAAALALAIAGWGHAQAKPAAKQQPMQMRSTTQAQRKAARIHAAPQKTGVTRTFAGVSAATATLSPLAVSATAATMAPPLSTPDYFGVPNWANSPLPQLDPTTGALVPGTGMRKFVDALPGLCGTSATATNGLGQCIPVATPDRTTFGNADFYRLAVGDYSQQLHSDLPPTRLRGYVQLDATGAPVGPHQYLGPLIVATRDRPVRVLFQNQVASDLFIPVDTTYMGAGMVSDGTTTAPASQRRADLHLHGGNTPWISDGTTHQWITPAGDAVPAARGFAKGFSFQNVPDMVGPGTLIPTPSLTDGLGTYYWTNQQSGRLMFFHDHAYGLTRLNVYAGEAAGYLLVDPNQEAGLQAATVPGTIPDPANLATADLAHLVPLVIQDKTFVPDDGVAGGQLAATDPTWDIARHGGKGSFWFPHVYMPNQNPYDQSGANPFGRWDYGPWFWPPQNPASLESPPVACTSAAYPGQTITCPGTPNPSGTPEGFMDTPLVNGTAYPTLTVSPTAYRFQILSAGNDRTWNLGLYYAATASGTICKGGAVADLSTCTEVSMLPAVPPAAGTALPLCPLATASDGGGLTRAALDASGNPLNGTGLPAGCWPTAWPTDGRDGGVPDPTTAGPPIVQLATEGGLLPAPAVIPSTPVGYEYNRRSITVLNIMTHGLLLGPAERADVVVDFSSVPPGSALVLYNDAPAPVPAFDSRADYYTGAPDQTDTGGAPSTLPGFGPNTRTVMQLQVVGTPSATFQLAALSAAMPALFAGTQDPVIVPETAYGAPVDNYVRIENSTVSFFMGPLGGITVTNGGTGYTAAPAVTISGGGGSGATATATLTPRSVAAFTVTAGGTGYTAAPSVALTGGGGSGATAAATLTATTIASIAVSSGGSGYTSPPTVTIFGGGGSGATATATLQNKRVSAITVTNRGSGYTTPPAVTFSGGGGSGAAATARLTPTSVASLTVVNPGTGYTSAPTVTLSGGGGGGAAATATLTTAAVANVALTNPGTGYTSAPTVAIAGDGTGATAVATPPQTALLPKAIQELFTLDYGRMNATLGVEMPFTNFTTQTTIPYGYADPPTELFKDGETQLWKITHNGVDTHFIHFHLFTVQVVNRVGWDGAIKPPDANELSWKDTVRMNPLEDIVVALRPLRQTGLPFNVPNSVRPLDVTMPLGATSTMKFTNVDPTNQPAAVVNDLVNFGWEYVWHCHILGHEENDMMRPMALAVTPGAPANVAAAVTGKGQVTVSWANPASSSASELQILRATVTGSTPGAFTPIGTAAPSATSFVDRSVVRRTTYQYQVVARNVVGYTRTYAPPAVGYPSTTAASAPVASNAVTP